MTFIKILAALGGVFALVCLLAYAFQGRMIFFPERRLAGAPDDLGLAFEEIRFAAEDGVRLHGWFIPGPGGGTTPTALFFHGNAGNISHRLAMVDCLHGLGLACCMVDYRGYGRSGGSPSEDGLYRDAEAAWRWLVQDKGLKPREIVCWGRSLGGAVAARLARDRQPGALIVESSFTSLPDIGRTLYPFLPVRLIARYRFATIASLRKAPCPILVVHSRDDEIVPFRFGRELFEAAPEPKRFLEIRGGHNQGFHVSGARYEQGITDFLKACGLLEGAAGSQGDPHGERAGRGP